MTGRFEIGRYELASAVSRPGFFHSEMSVCRPELGGGVNPNPSVHVYRHFNPPTVLTLITCKIGCNLQYVVP